MEKKRPMKIIPTIIFAISLCVGCQAGCGEPEVPFSDTLPVASDEPEIKDNKVEKIGVYVDATPSMKGFLGMQEEFYKKLVGETVYLTCLDELDNLLSVKYDREDMDYYRVDTPLWRSGENVLKKAKDAAFYSDKLYAENKKKYKKIDLIKGDGEGYGSYCLTNALLNCRKDDLSIIVTDFYENEVASSDVTAALKKNMSFGGNAERTIGLVGIKSEFAGDIYDLPGKKGAVTHGSLNSKAKKKDIKYRQFFVIVIGGPKEVTEFCNDLQENMGLEGGRVVSTVFYENELYGLDYHDYRKCFSRNDKRKNYFMPLQRMVINGEEVPEQYIYQYKNITDESKEIVVSYAVDSESLKTRLRAWKPDTVSIPIPEPCEKELAEIPFTMENNMVGVWDENAFIVSEDHIGAFEVQRLYYSQQDNLLYVVFRMNDVQKLNGGFKFYVELGTDSEQKDELCDWADDWNISKQNLDYEKTLRLKDYVEAIKLSMPEHNHVMLSFSFYVYVE